MNITVETWHDAHMQKLEMVYNCEPCSTAGTGHTTLSSGDIYVPIKSKVDKEATAMMQALAPGATIS